MIHRRVPLARSAPLTRSGPPKRVNAKRKAKESTRAYGAKARRDWSANQPCAVCGWIGNSEAAHCRNDGAGRKADAHLTLPMCGPHFVVYSRRHCALVEGCHAEQHRIGTKEFERQHKVSLFHLAGETNAAWLAHIVDGGA